MEDELVEIGHSGKPHGIKGEVTLYLHNRESRLLEAARPIMLFPSDDTSSLAPVGQKFILKKISYGNKVIASLEGIESRNAIEDIIPFLIKEERENFPIIDDENEFYTVDLVGCQVYEFEGNQLFGEITEFYSNGVQDIFIVKGSGKFKGKKWEIPFVENFFKEVDIDQNKVFVILPSLI